MRDTTRACIPILRPATGEAAWQAPRDPILAGWLPQGPRVAAFEKAFAARPRNDLMDLLPKTGIASRPEDSQTVADALRTVA